MATICPPPIQGKTTFSKLLIREDKITSYLQSPERQQLAEVTERIWRKLTPSEQALETPEDSGEIRYNAVPPKRTFKVQMRYQFKGRMEPLPYPLDDE